MKLVTFKSAAGARAGILLAEAVVDLPRCDPKLPQSVRGILEAGEPVLRRLQSIANAPPRDALVANATLLAPIPDPRIVLSCELQQHRFGSFWATLMHALTVHRVERGEERGRLLAKADAK